MDVKQLGAYVREKRLAAGKSLRLMARILKIDPAALSRFERGERVLLKPALERVCTYYNVNIVSMEKVAFLEQEAKEKEPVTVTCDRCLARKKIWI